MKVDDGWALRRMWVELGLAQPGRSQAFLAPSSSLWV